MRFEGHEGFSDGWQVAEGGLCRTRQSSGGVRRVEECGVADWASNHNGSESLPRANPFLSAWLGGKLGHSSGTPHTLPP